MKLFVALMLVFSLSAQAWAGYRVGGNAAEIDVASHLVYSTTGTGAFRFDPQEKELVAVGWSSFWFSASHAKHFVDFIDNHMSDMTIAYLQTKKPQSWTVRADNDTTYTFSVDGWPDELYSTASKFDKATMVRVSTGKERMYIPSTVFATSWRSALTPESIARYEKHLAPVMKLLKEQKKALTDEINREKILKNPEIRQLLESGRTPKPAPKPEPPAQPLPPDAKLM